MIYFIKHTDFVKIGFTDNILKRLSQLQVSCPIKLEVLALIDGVGSDERLLHEQFTKHNSECGEWFMYDEAMKKYIESLPRELMWKYGFDDNNTNKFGELRNIRLSNNLSLEEIANTLGMSKQSVADMEKREVRGTITINSMRKVCSAIGYSFEYRLRKI